MTDLKLAVTRGDAPMLYLTSTGSYTVRFHLRLDERIREDAMRIALDRTAERYPYFCVSVKKSDKEIYYAENRAPAALLHSSEPPVLNTAQTNGHIWAVSYDDDHLYVDFYHGRADGAGIYPLLATLLYYYYRERDGLSDDSGIRTLEKAVTVAETRDPVDDLPLIDLSAFKLPPAVPALNVMREKNLSRSGNKGFTHRISIPMESFIPFIKDNDATPGLMVCILFARAIMQPFEEDVYYDAFIEELRDHKISFIDLGKEPISISDIVYQT